MDMNEIKKIISSMLEVYNNDMKDEDLMRKPATFKEIAVTNRNTLQRVLSLLEEYDETNRTGKTNIIKRKRNHKTESVD